LIFELCRTGCFDASHQSGGQRIFFYTG
jgi:hypothetical protein